MNGLRLPHDWFDYPLPKNIHLGDRTWVYSSFAFLHYRSQRPCGLRLGDDTGLYNGSFLDLGPEGEVSIGNYCAIVGAIICTNGRVSIGDHAFIAHEVVLAHCDAAQPFYSAASPIEKSPELVIEDNVWIGARACLIGGIRVGRDSIIGAAAVVRDDVPPMSIMAGNPARRVGTVNSGSSQQKE